MKQTTIKAYGKINIGLDVVGRREDGYHLVKMVMQTVDLHDVVELELLDEPTVTMECNDEALPVDDSNLCVKAAKVLLEEFAPDTGVHIKLTKNLPVAAGMAGGSTDGAAVFTGLNELLNLGLTTGQLCERAVALGADIPYCIMGGTALSEGIGEVLTPLAPLPQYLTLIAKPAIGVSTKEVYQALDSLESPVHPPMDALVTAIAGGGELDAMAPHMGNILEDVTIEKYPIIEKIKDTMLQNGAVIAMMSGSGPTVFGLFADQSSLEEATAAVKAAGDASYIRQTRLT